VNRTELQRLAAERLDDARIPFGKGKWSAAYYLAGYAIECALKSCVLKHLDTTGFIFKDRDGLKGLEKKYWIHDLEGLVGLAGLVADFGAARGNNPVLESYWAATKDWDELSRYEERTEPQARDLLEAIGHDQDGVLKWLQSRW